MGKVAQTMKNQDELKREAAEAALAYVSERLEADGVIGVGTGSTTNHFIDLLGGISARVAATVVSTPGARILQAAHRHDAPNRLNLDCSDLARRT